MVSVLRIKNPITGIYRTLPFINGRWSSKLKCMARYGRDNFKVLVGIPLTVSMRRIVIVREFVLRKQ